MISAAENSNKFQKPRFWKEKSVEDVVILGPTAQPHKVIIIVQVRAGKKIYVAAVEALRKRDRQDETQFTSKIGGKTSLGPS